MAESELTKKRKRNEIIAAYNSRSEAAKEFSNSLDLEGRQKVAVVLRAAGLGLDAICQALDIPRNQVNALLRKEENQKIIGLVREVQKQELVVNGLQLQRKYLETLLNLPASPGTAAAHASLVKALATLYDKTALAAGEATERVESRTISITLDEKRVMWEQLKEAQEMRFAREQLALPAGDRTG